MNREGGKEGRKRKKGLKKGKMEAETMSYKEK